MSPNLIGQALLKQYRVDAFIASGGMGAVYRVWDLKRNVPLAMKVLQGDLAEDPVVFKRFQREANALKKLAHPNIVPTYGLFQTADFAFLLERFIDGPSLKDVLKQCSPKPLGMNEVLTFMKALCAALGYAHAYEVVHCDVKPGNVMVDRGGNIFLTDFGIARHSDSTTTTMGTAGTPGYMAPEQIRGEPVSPATDVYALGVMLFEMLTGQRPFRGSEAGTEKGGATANERIRYAHLTLPPPDPGSLNPNISMEMRQVILKALEKQSKNRFQSTQELYSAFCQAAQQNDNFIGDRYALPQGNETGYITPAPSQPAPTRRRISPLVIGSIAVVVVGVAALAILGLPKPGPEARATATKAGIPVYAPSPAVPTYQVAVNPIPTDTTAPTEIVNRTTTGGQWAAYSYGAQQGNRAIYEVNVNNSTSKQVTFPGSVAGDNAPSFSPDGRSIVFWRWINSEQKGYIFLQDANGTVKQLTFKLSAFPSWCRNPSRNWILYQNRDDEGQRRIWMINLDSGNPERLTTGSNDGGADWSWDCDQFSYVGSDGIHIVDKASMNDRFLGYYPEQGSSLYGPHWSLDGEWLVFNLLKDTTGDGFARTADDVSDLYIIRTDGTGLQNLTNGEYWAYAPSFSPDGSQILFLDFKPDNNVSGGSRLVIYDRPSGNFNVISESGPYNHAVWGP